jgi:effector-binding domain-containing protein
VTDHKVSLARAVPRPTAVIAATTSWAEYATMSRKLLDEVHAGVAWGGLGRKGRNITLILDDTPRVEVGVEIDQPIRTSGRVVRSALPAGAVATTVHRGPHEDLAAAHAAVRRWCAEQSIRIAGPRWEVYGHWNDDPELRETEVSYLLR